MRAWGRGVVVALLGAATGTGCRGGGPECDVEQFVVASTKGEALTDCGTFELGSVIYTDEAMQAAQQCVLNAIARGSAFRLVYDAAQPGTKGALSGGAGGMQLRAYAVQGNFGDAGAGFVPQVSGRSCDQLNATPNCSPKVGLPCLSCENPGSPSLLCVG